MTVRTVIGVPFGERTGGSETMLCSLLAHRDAAALEPHVWFGEDGPFRAEIEALGVPTLVAGGRRPAIAAVRRLVQQQRPDILLSWLPRAHVVTGPVAALTGLRRRTVCMQHILPTGNWRHMLAFALPTSLVVATSEASATAQRRLRPHRPVAVVRPGIDAPAPLDGAALADLRRRCDLDEQLPVIGIVGRLIGWKGQERLLEAVIRLREGGRHAQLLIVGGEDPHEQDGTAGRLRERTRAAGLDGRVRYVGHVPDAHNYIQLCDVLVNASEPEPFGIVLLEAMALGVPVVAVAAGGPLEIVEPDTTGLLVPSGDPAHLAAGIAEVLDDPAGAARRAAAARRRFEARFSAERMAADMRSVLAGLAAGAA